MTNYNNIVADSIIESESDYTQYSNSNTTNIVSLVGGNKDSSYPNGGFPPIYVCKTGKNSKSARTLSRTSRKKISKNPIMTSTIPISVIMAQKRKQLRLNRS